MGSGSGVLQAFFLWNFVRGVTDPWMNHWRRFGVHGGFSGFVNVEIDPRLVGASGSFPPGMLCNSKVGIAGTATLYVAEQTGVAQSLMAFSRGIGMISGPLVMSKILGKLKLG